MGWEDYIDSAPSKPKTDSWEGAVAKPSKLPGAEIKQGRKKGWRETASDIYTPVLEGGGMALGGATGAAGGALLGPVTSGIGAVGGAGVGNWAGHKAAKGADILLGVDKTPDEQPEFLKDFVAGAGGEMTGGLGNRLLYGVSKIHSPSKLAMRNAGEELSVAEAVYPPEVAKQKKKVFGAMERTGIPAIPRANVTGSGTETALEKTILGDITKVASTPAEKTAAAKVAEDLQHQRVQAPKIAEKKVNAVIPHEPKAAEVVRSKVEAYDAGVAAKEAEIATKRQEVIDRINANRKLNVSKAARGEAQASEADLRKLEAQYDADFKKQYGQNLRPVAEGGATPEQEIGENIYSKAKEAKALSAARFSSEETGYNQPKFTNAAPVTGKNKLAATLAAEKPPIGFSSHVDAGSKLEKILPSGADVPVKLPDLNYKTLREISSAAGNAERSAQRSPADGSRNVAVYFGKIKDAAEKTISDMLEKEGGADLAAEYKKINTAFASQQVPAYLEGEIGNTVLATGREAGKLKRGMGEIPKLFENPTNADDLIRALGTAKLSATGSMEPLTKEAIAAAGVKDAAGLVKPYFDQQIAAVYQAAGGGAKGAKAVANWVNDAERAKILQKYGIFDEYAVAAKKASSLEGLLGKTSKGEKVPVKLLEDAKIDLVGKTLGVDDPYKIYNHLVNSDNPAQAAWEIMRVSSDPSYRAAVKALVRDGIKEDIKNTGINPFIKNPSDLASKKLRALLPQVYSKSEIQTLKDFHTIMDAVEPVGAKGSRIKSRIGEAGKDIGEAIEATPVGYKGYRAKRGLLLTRKILGEKYDAATIRVLGQAMTDPKVAEAALRAFKAGETNPLRRLIQDSYENDKFMMRLLRRVPGVGVTQGVGQALAPSEE